MMKTSQSDKNIMYLIALLTLGVFAELSHSACTTTYEYNNFGDVTRTKTESGSLADTKTFYDNFGRTTAVVQYAAQNGSANDMTSRFVYDVAGHILTQAIKHGNDSQSIESTDLRSIYTYDVMGRKVTSRGPSRSFTTNMTPTMIYVYDVGGNSITQKVLQTETPSVVYAVTTTVYDALNRATKVTNPEGHYSVIVYDSNSRVIRQEGYNSSEQQLSQSRSAYDKAGRVTQMANMLFESTPSNTAASVTTDNVANFIYDADGRVVTQITYNMGTNTPRNTVSQYDGFGRLTKTINAKGFYDATEFNDVGQTTKRIIYDGEQQVFAMAYDGSGYLIRSISVGSPNLTTHYAYDKLGRRTLITDPKGYSTFYEYDLLGRQIRLTEDFDGTLPRDTYFYFSKMGHLVQQVAIDETAQETSYDYTPTGLLSTVTFPDSIETYDRIDFTYLPNGKLTIRKEQAGSEGTRPAINYVYNLRGLLSSIDNGSSYQKSYFYDGLGRMTRVKKGTLASPAADSDTSYFYDDLSRVTKESQQILGSSDLTKYLYSEYDQAGNRIKLFYPRNQ